MSKRGHDLITLRTYPLLLSLIGAVHLVEIMTKVLIKSN